MKEEQRDLRNSSSNRLQKLQAEHADRAERSEHQSKLEAIRNQRRGGVKFEEPLFERPKEEEKGARKYHKRRFSYFVGNS